MEKSTADQIETQKSYETEHSEDHVDTGYTAPPTFGQRYKRHCARFWWLHLLIFCIVFLIISLCLVYVAMPKIAQHGVSEAWLEFTNIQFLSPTEQSITITQDAIVHSPSVYTPTLDPFNASLYLLTDGVYASEPMMIVPMPSIHALHPQSNASIQNEVLQIANLDQVTDYAIQVMTQENITTALVGKTKLHEGKLPVTEVTYNSTSTYKALNGLKGFNVTNVQINLTAPAGTPNMQGTAYIPNPSILTIEMGTVTLNLATAKSGIIGNSTIENMTLVPGDNNLPMTAIIDQALVTANLNSSGWITLSIIGNSSVFNGQHLTYYEKALASNALTLDMNILGILTGS
jgi:cytoskeletal protein RodZ